jgi:16S rRNA (uracil1498-N3)-methyltransferase
MCEKGNRASMCDSSDYAHEHASFKPIFLQATRLCCCLRLLSSAALSPVTRKLVTEKLPRLYVGQSIQNEDFNVRELMAAMKQQALAPKLVQGGTILLSKEQSHYLSTVLRSKNKSVRLFDGAGEEWLADVGQEGRDTAIAIPKEKLRATSGQDHIGGKSFWLCLPELKKRDRMKWLIEKTTELGCSGYLLMNTDYSERSSLQSSKLFAYAVEASEQCERLDLPRFISADRPVKLSSFLESAATLDYTVSENLSILLCRERLDARPLLQVLQETKRRIHEQKQVCLLLVGPEGGWSPDEEQLMDDLQSKRPDIVANVSLGPRILRTETAAVAAIAAYQLLQDVSQLHDHR